MSSIETVLIALKQFLQVFNVVCIMLASTGLGFSLWHFVAVEKVERSEIAILLYYIATTSLVAFVTIGLRYPLDRVSAESEMICYGISKGITISYVMSHIAIYWFYYLRSELTQGLVRNKPFLEYLRVFLRYTTFIAPIFAVLSGVFTNGWVIGDPGWERGMSWCWITIDPILGILFLFLDTCLCFGYTLTFTLPLTYLDSIAESVQSSQINSQVPGAASIASQQQSQSRKLQRIAKKNANLSVLHFIASFLGLCTTSYSLYKLFSQTTELNVIGVRNATKLAVMNQYPNSTQELREYVYPLMVADTYMATSEVFMFFADGFLIPLLPFMMKQSWLPKWFVTQIGKSVMHTKYSGRKVAPGAEESGISVLSETSSVTRGISETMLTTRKKTVMSDRNRDSQRMGGRTFQMNDENTLVSVQSIMDDDD